MEGVQLMLSMQKSCSICQYRWQTNMKQFNYGVVTVHISLATRAEKESFGVKVLLEFGQAVNATVSKHIWKQSSTSHLQSEMIPICIIIGLGGGALLFLKRSQTNKELCNFCP